MPSFWNFNQSLCSECSLSMLVGTICLMMMGVSQTWTQCVMVRKNHWWSNPQENGGHDIAERCVCKVEDKMEPPPPTQPTQPCLHQQCLLCACFHVSRRQLSNSRVYAILCTWAVHEMIYCPGKKLSKPKKETKKVQSPYKHHTIMIRVS